MVKLNPYLKFNGNADAAYLFYKSVFVGQFAELRCFANAMSPPDFASLSDADKSKIMHSSLPISRNNVLMGNDILGFSGWLIIKRQQSKGVRL